MYPRSVYHRYNQPEVTADGPQFLTWGTFGTKKNCVDKVWVYYRFSLDFVLGLPYRGDDQVYVRNHPFKAWVKFSEKLTFLNPWHTNVCIRIKR